MTASRRAVFFDYGGTLAPSSSASLTDDGVASIEITSSAGFLVVVASNQKGVAQGRKTWDDLLRLRQSAEHLLMSSPGARIDGWYFCPHESADGCECRKPKPGLLIQAAEELDVDLTESAIVGNRAAKDVAAGRAVGMRTGLVISNERSNAAGIVPDLSGSTVLAVTMSLLRQMA